MPAANRASSRQRQGEGASRTLPGVVPPLLGLSRCQGSWPSGSNAAADLSKAASSRADGGLSACALPAEGVEHRYVGGVQARRTLKECSALIRFEQSFEERSS